MSDRELLKDAAKAAGLTPDVGVNIKTGHLMVTGEGVKQPFFWNPLVDSGEALELAVKLRLLCGFVQPNCWAELPGQYPSYEPYEPDPYAATRRAIVRAAAEIGRSMT